MAELKKELGLLDVFAVSTGAMISSGLFVLPAIAYAKAGPAVILSYLFASILVIPSALSKAELATAMPRAGGDYFFIERSLGSMWGVYSGFAAWFSLALKSAFAVVGMAVLIEIILQQFFSVVFSEWHIKLLSTACCIFFMTLNVLSVKHTSRFQIILVAALLVILSIFVIFGVKFASPGNYKGFLQKGWLNIFATAGLVFVSFGGLTKVASISEEVKQPSRNLPLGMLLSWLVVSFFYVTVVAVTVGTLTSKELEESHLPISLSANKFLGPVGFVILSLAAVSAFLTTANGGILAASRSPMAMSRDQLLPVTFSSVSKRFRTPHISIIATSGFMIAAIIFLDIEMLVKTASTFKLILFALGNVSVIIMRESRIQSYRPEFKSPLYPYIHIVSVIIYGVLLVYMGTIPLLICGCFFGLSAVWYLLYVSKRVSRASAVMHIVERVTDRELKTVTLENELRDILIERDDIIEDRFDKLIKQCEVIDMEGRQPAEDVFRQLSSILAGKLNVNEYVLFEKFLLREEQGSTIVQPGLAIPHIIVDGEKKFDIVVVRAIEGIDFPHADVPIKIMFVLAGSKDERNYHLRALMAIAQIAQEKDFENQWLAARDTAGIRNLILLSKRQRDINLP